MRQLRIVQGVLMAVTGFVCSPEVAAKIAKALDGVEDPAERVAAVEDLLEAEQLRHDAELAELVDCEGFPQRDATDADGKTNTVRRTKFKGRRRIDGP